MGGGLMQLVAMGAQDVFLTGNPQITFFKVMYKRHTNFSKECIEQNFNGKVSLGGNATCTLARNGDLVQEIYVKINFTNQASADGPSSGVDLTTIIKYVEVEIGGQKIDKHYSQWLDIYNELFETKHDNRLLLSSGSLAASATNTLYIPLRFWFNKNAGLALPLIALQYHEVKINVKFGESSVLYNKVDITTFNSKLLVNYIYLDTDERRRFAQVSHEYLIEQIQHTGTETLTTSSSNIELNFNHPIKALFWTTDGKGYISENTLQLNGHDRFSKQENNYFHIVQPYECGLGMNGKTLVNNGVTTTTTTAAAKVKIDTDAAGDASILAGSGGSAATTSAATGATYTNNVTTELGKIATSAASATTAGIFTSFLGYVNTTISDWNIAKAQILNTETAGNSAKGAVTTLTTIGEANNAKSFIDALLRNGGGTVAAKGANLLIKDVRDRIEISVTQANNLVISTTATGVPADITAADTVKKNITDAKTAIDFLFSLTQNTVRLTNIALVSVNTLISTFSGGISFDRTWTGVKHINVNNPVGMYSFCLKPAEHQPSGSCNFSRIDNAKLRVTGILNSSITSCNLYIFALNYNVLRIMSGMGGLTYSN